MELTQKHIGCRASYSAPGMPNMMGTLVTGSPDHNEDPVMFKPDPQFWPQLEKLGYDDANDLYTEQSPGIIITLI